MRHRRRYLPCRFIVCVRFLPCNSARSFVPCPLELARSVCEIGCRTRPQRRGQGDSRHKDVMVNRSRLMLLASLLLQYYSERSPLPACEDAHPSLARSQPKKTAQRHTDRRRFRSVGGSFGRASTNVTLPDRTVDQSPVGHCGVGSVRPSDQTRADTAIERSAIRLHPRCRGGRLAHCAVSYRQALRIQRSRKRLRWI